nr:MAG TPA_asm: hypothetical protein [Caudoviricetes sp.]
MPLTECKKHFFKKKSLKQQIPSLAESFCFAP